MRLRIVLLFINAQDNRDVFVLRRRRDDHFLHGAVQVLLRVFRSEAFEMMLCAFGSYCSSLTPRTIVMSSFFAGAEMITFFTVPCRCFFASSAFVKMPVDSITISAPTDSQSIAAGSRCENTRNSSPSTEMPFSVEVIS